MEQDINKYTYHIIRSEEDQEFIGLCAEFPGLSWLEPDPQNALKGIRSVVKDCIEDMALTGDDISVIPASKNVRPLVRPKKGH